MQKEQKGCVIKLYCDKRSINLAYITFRNKQLDEQRKRRKIKSTKTYFR